MTSVPDLTLNNGQTIPQFGFGVFKVTPEECVEATLTALEAGYRHIDTAQMYGNEREVGEAVRKSGLDRDEVFVTSKLNNGFHLPDDARSAFDRTMAALDLDYVDLFLIHWPLPTRYDGDFVSTWRTLEEFYRDGRARSIGVSNFHVNHLNRLITECDVAPAVNQIEVHPYLTQTPLREFCIDKQIAVEAWGPIARGMVADDPVISAIAERHGKTNAQVTLRWHIQRGDIVFPKSIRPERIRENIDIFDFELADDEIATITALNRDERTGPDPDTFDYIPQ
jgi:2,5-diketo-D-gluconate reductase A